MVNLILMILLFTANSFIFWLADFQQEYLGTDMYVLFYANGIVAIISGNINLLLYHRLGMKFLLILTNIVGMVSTFIMILSHETFVASSKSQTKSLFLSIMTPSVMFLLSLCIQVGYTTIVQCAFEDDRILPFKIRATSINIIVLVSKTVTIGAPFVNEMEEPIPLYFILAF